MRLLVVSVLVTFAVILHNCQEASAKNWYMSKPMQPIPGCWCVPWKDRYRCKCPIGHTPPPATTTSTATATTTVADSTTTSTTTAAPTESSTTSTTSTTAAPTESSTTATTSTTAAPTESTTTSTTTTTAAPTESSTTSTTSTTAAPTESSTTSTTSTTAAPTESSTTSTTTTTAATTESTTTASCEYPTGHTMCLPASDLYESTCTVDPTVILSKHNEFRATLPDTQTTATNMQKMYWDDELAAIAQAWANQCVLGHDKSGNRSMLGLVPNPGQNGAFGGSLTWASAIDLWYAEVSDFVYGTGAVNDGVIGHFTQMVMSGSVRIGCGCAMCNEAYTQYMFCNYMGPSFGHLQATPYESGPTQCSACPDKCDSEGLCDCGGTYCYNYGTINLNSCLCN